MVHPYIEMLLSHEKEWIIDAQNNLEDSEELCSVKEALLFQAY